MDLQEAIDRVKMELSPSRFEHTLRVVEESERLAIRFGGNIEKVKLAAALHDFAKNWPAEKLKDYIIKNDLPEDLLDHHKELWHGPVGANVAKKEFGISDSEVLGAIRYHTTGRAQMSKVEMIVYLADYIEPGRSFPGLAEVRVTSKESLPRACGQVARNTLLYLVQRNNTVHPDSLHAYNDLTRIITTEGFLDE